MPNAHRLGRSICKKKFQYQHVCVTGDMHWSHKHAWQLCGDSQCPCWAGRKNLSNDPLLLDADVEWVSVLLCARRCAR